MSQELREVAGRLEFYEGNVQKSIDGELIASTYEEGKALAAALCDETDYLEQYANTAENLDVLVRVSQKLNRHNPLPNALTKSRLIEAYRVANAAGGACGDAGTLEKSVEEPEESVAPVARDPETGQFKNQLLAEYHQMLSDPTVHSSQITKRLQSDRAFREAVESESKPKTSGSREAATDEQLAFAEAYRREANPKFVGGYITIGGTRYTKPEFDHLLSECARFRI